MIWICCPNCGEKQKEEDVWIKRERICPKCGCRWFQ